MNSHKFHDKPFQPHTLVKLGIFAAYTSAWLPVFVAKPKFRRLLICDLFAGRGYDSKGVAGSAIRTLDEIRMYDSYLHNNDIRIDYILNEGNPNHFASLQSAISEYRDSMPHTRRIDFSFFNDNTENLLPRIEGRFGHQPTLVFLDQTGTKHLTAADVTRMAKKRFTDYLIFVASGNIRRLGQTKEMGQYVGHLDVQKIKSAPSHLAHREVTAELNRLVPEGSDFRFYPFSLKANTNVYGLVFGASHPLAVDKFLKVAWDTNATNGDANFDIDGDLDRENNPSLFPDLNPPNKLDAFRADIKGRILRGEISNSKDLYLHCTREGFLGDHADDVLKELGQSKKIQLKGRSNCTRISSLKSGKTVLFTRIGK